MAVCIGIIVFGAAAILYAATDKDCQHCWHRDKTQAQMAWGGFGLVIVGCILACLKFAGVL